MAFFKATRPSKRAGTSNHQFTRRIPKSILDRIAGHRLVVVLPALRQSSELLIDKELRSIISFSLGTSDTYVVDDRISRCDNALIHLLEKIRCGTEVLSESQIESYAQSIFMFYKDNYVDSTGLPSETKTIESIVAIEDLFKMREIFCKDFRKIQYWQIYEYPFFIGYKSSDTSQEAIKFRVGDLVNWWMYRNDMRLSFDNRQRLMFKVDQIVRYVELSGKSGYVTPVFIPSKDSSGRFVSFDTIIDAWKAEQTRYETIRKRVAAVASLQKSFGGKNANDVTFDDLIKWIDAIRPKYAPITINNVMIAGVKAVFGHAKYKKLIDMDHTKDLRRIKNPKLSSDGIPYTDQEVMAFVDAARIERDPIVRYVVLLLAATGGRFSEIAQLGSDQVHDATDSNATGSVSWLEIRASSFGGDLKTSDSERNVPLTDILIQRDFFQFAKSRQGKPLFYDVNEKFDGDGKQYDSIRSKTGPWLGRFPKSDPKTKTHHGFRHWIYTRAGDVKIRREIVNDFTGHAREGAQGGYGRRSSVQILSEEMEAAFKIFRRDP